MSNQKVANIIDVQEPKTYLYSVYIHPLDFTVTITSRRKVKPRLIDFSFIIYKKKVIVCIYTIFYNDIIV